MARRPKLELVYQAPTTAEQLTWATNRVCNVTVAVPVPVVADEACHPVDAASGLALSGTSSCPHLQLTAAAATTAQSCEITVNGLDLFAGCGLDRLVIGRDGVRELPRGFGGSSLIEVGEERPEVRVQERRVVGGRSALVAEKMLENLQIVSSYESMMYEDTNSRQTRKTDGGKNK